MSNINIPGGPLLPPDINVSSIYSSNTMKVYSESFMSTIDMNNNSIINLADPVNDQDAANKEYVDNNAFADLTGPITSIGPVTSIGSQTGTGTTFVVASGPTINGLTVSGGLTTDTLDATSTSNIGTFGIISGGAVVVAGGARIAQDFYIGGTLYLHDNNSGSAPPYSMGQIALPGTNPNFVNVSNTTLVGSLGNSFGNVFLTVQNIGGTPGNLWISNKSSGTFTINSSNISDTSTVSWVVINYVGICFYHECMATLEDLSMIKLSDLTYGQKVLSHYDDNDTPIFSKIISFSGFDLECVGASIKIFTENNEYITLSPEHLMFSVIDNKYVRTEQLKVNSLILCNNTPTKIIAISIGHHKGFVSPLTDSGLIVVNNISCSCHTHDSHDLVRFIYGPLRLYLKLWPTKDGTKPTGNSWFAINYRRGTIGSLLKFLFKPFF